jgi:predicted metal-dependent hydrolase
MVREKRETVLAIDGLDVRVVRKDVRGLILHVTRDGGVWVSAPRWASMSDVSRLVSSHREWVDGRRSQARAHERSRWLAGDTLDVWGTARPIRWQDTSHSHSSAVLDGDHVVLLLAKGDKGIDDEATAARRKALAGMARTALLSTLPDVVPRCEGVVGQTASEWRCRAMRTRWGSCSIRIGRIWLNAELATRPPSCLECVITHELCHLIDPHHDARFHSLMDEFYPDWRDVRRLLASKPMQLV